MTQYDLVFPNQEKEGLSVFEITFFYNLENKHFLFSYSRGQRGEEEMERRKGEIVFFKAVFGICASYIVQELEWTSRNSMQKTHESFEIYNKIKRKSLLHLHKLSCYRMIYSRLFHKINPGSLN